MEGKTMTFYDFCELALSNDIIGIVPDVVRGEPVDIDAAYRWLLSNSDLLNKTVTRFTYGKCSVGDYAGRYILYVSLS